MNLLQEVKEKFSVIGKNWDISDFEIQGRQVTISKSNFEDIARDTELSSDLFIAYDLKFIFSADLSVLYRRKHSQKWFYNVPNRFEIEVTNITDITEKTILELNNSNTKISQIEERQDNAELFESITVEDQLKEQVRLLTEQLSQRDSTISSLNDRITGLENTITGLNAQLNQKDSEISDLNNNKEELENEINDLRNGIEETDLIRSLRAEIVEKNAEIVRLQNIIVQKDTEIAELQNDKNQLNNYKDLYEEILPKYNALLRIYDEKNKLLRENEELKENIEELNKNITSLEEEITKLNNKIKELENTNVNLEFKISSLTNMVDYFERSNLRTLLDSAYNLFIEIQNNILNENFNYELFEITKRQYKKFTETFGVHDDIEGFTFTRENLDKLISKINEFTENYRTNIENYTAEYYHYRE